MTKRFYIGLATSFHDPAIAIVDPEGTVVFAEASERFYQDKRAFDCPPDPIFRAKDLIAEYCDPDAELVVASSWSNFALSLARRASALDALLPRGASIAMWRAAWKGGDRLAWPWPSQRAMFVHLLSTWLRSGQSIALAREFEHRTEIRRYDHHLTHAAYAAFASPFERAGVAVVDGSGEGRSTAFYHYDGRRLRAIEAGPRFPRGDDASLGFFYAKICHACGFDPMRGDEWKVMGLAPYGKLDEELAQFLRGMITVDGLRLRAPGTSRHQDRLLEELQRRRRADDAPPEAAADLAFTGQSVFCEVMSELLSNFADRVDTRALVLGGGCALNSAYNGQIVERTPFRECFVPSAPADDGNAIGAAWLAFAHDHPDWQPPREPLTPYLGSRPCPSTLEQLATESGLPFERLGPDALARRVAGALAEGKIVGWMQGRAEFGPRALGHRSILADPRRPEMKQMINAKVKQREPYRPFAPVVLPEFGDAYFERYQPTPYMERALRFRPDVRSRVPAVVHEDGTGRPQTVDPTMYPELHRLLVEFHALTGVPILLNTSFNIMGKPIVHSVEDAVAVFMTTGLDVLVVGDALCDKSRIAAHAYAPARDAGLEVASAEE